MQGSKLTVGALGTALVAGVCAFGVSANAASKIEWNMSTFGPPRAVTAGYEAVAKYIEEKSGGNFTMKIHYAESISPVRNHLDAIKIGAIDAAHFCTSYHPGKNPVGTVLDLAFLPIRSHEVMQDVHEDFYSHPDFLKEMANWGAFPYVSTVLPLYEFMGVGNPPMDLDSWKGMRVRALGGIGDAMRVLGAVPTTVPAPEVYTSLERGVISAASFPYSYTFAAYKMDEISKWFTEGMGLGSPNCPMAVSLAQYEALPAEYKQYLTEAEPLAYAAWKKSYGDGDIKYRPLYAAKMTKIVYTPEQRAAFIEKAGKPTWDAWKENVKKQGVNNGQELIDFVFASIEKADKKHGLTN